MEITIPEELQEFVKAKLEAGAFESPTAVIAAALIAWQARETYGAAIRDVEGHLLLKAIDSTRIPWDEATLDCII